MKQNFSINSIADCMKSIRRKNLAKYYQHSIADCKYSIANMSHSA